MACKQLQFSDKSGCLTYFFFDTEMVFGPTPSEPNPSEIDSSSAALRWLGEHAVMVRYRQIESIKERDGDHGLELTHSTGHQLRQCRLESFSEQQKSQLLTLLKSYLYGVLVDIKAPRAWWHAAINPVLAICFAVVAGYQVIVPLFWPTLMVVALVVVMALITLRLNLSQSLGLRIWQVQNPIIRGMKTTSFVLVSLLCWLGGLAVFVMQADYYFGEHAILHAYHEGRLSDRELNRLRLQGVSVDIKDEFGFTVLMYAAEADDVYLVGNLLRHGASPSQTDNQGQTALFHAIGSRNLALLGTLARQSNVNHRDAYGATPLMHMLEYDPTAQALAVLIENGASLNSTNRAGDSVLAQAFHHGVRSDVTELLIRSGARLTAHERMSAEYQSWIGETKTAVQTSASATAF
ncbi:ankyrin repeat domain-containing protein [Corallincola platygyrae]|uniref:Ankyrin repeat domain-containing protein n=1 Tax=Corallincola platygyrae TaxID=1193278 RepID=A0ABW4XQG9_9GAMM